MGKRRNKTRKQADILPAEVANHAADPPPVLRLVRSEEPGLPVEQPSPGCASEGVDAVLLDVGSGGLGEAEAGSSHVEPAAHAGTNDAREDRDYRALVRRSFDAADINPILNDPSVMQYVALPGMGSLDVTPLLEDYRNVLLMADGGGMLFCMLEPGMYEVHTTFLKPKRDASGKGPHIRNACLAAYHWMFVHTDCTDLVTRIPASNRAARIFSPLVGWTLEFERKNVWPTPDGLIDMSFHALRYDDWVRKTPGLAASGRTFHDRLSIEFERHGRVEPQHPDEECHDIHVGACAEMMAAGQLDKAVILYNRWAKFAGYGTITLIARNPAVVNIGNAIIQIVGDTFKVVKCL
jgi:hypothetical protein